MPTITQTIFPNEIRSRSKRCCGSNFYLHIRSEVSRHYMGTRMNYKAPDMCTL